MSENLADQAVRPTYEQIVAAIPDKGVHELLQGAQADEHRLGQELERVQANEDLTTEARERHADEVIARYSPKIADARMSAREKVARGAETQHLFSIPMPDKGALATTKAKDAQEMIAIQNESAALRAHASEVQRKASMDGKVKLNHDPRLKVLKEAYSAAMGATGIEAKVGALAAIKAAEGLGVDIEELVSEHRTEIHQRALADAERFERAMQVLPSGKSAPANPFAGKRQGAKAVGTYSSESKAVMGNGRPKLFEKKRRKPAWK
jgi:hypothetical protein